MSIRFIGRTKEVAAVLALLDAHRVVSLVGVGGIGKTRLALRAIEDARWPSTVCELASVRDTNEACAAIARALDVDPGDEQTLGRALAARGPMVLVLDDIERLLPNIARLIASWIDAAPELRVLVTSRERLRIEAEVVSEVPPLDSAVELFVDRAGIQPEDPLVIERLVARLDRIPLAIELAAARAHITSPAELLERLEKSLDALGRAGPDRAPRQATMRAALAWSWDVLGDREKHALARLSVFRGGFSLDAAEAVSEESAEIIDSLEAKSLIRAQREGDKVRFSIYDVVRAFAGEHVDEGAAALHTSWFVQLCERVLAGKLDASTLRHDRANFDAAFERASPEERLMLASCIDRIDGSPLTERELTLLDAALETPSSHGASALLVRAQAHTHAGRLDEAEADARHALELTTDPALSALAYIRLGYALFRRGDMRGAIDADARALDLFASLGDTRGRIAAIQDRAIALVYIGRATDARADFELIRDLSRAVNHRQGEASAENGIAFSALDLGDFEIAREHYERCIELGRDESPRTAMVSTCFLGIAYLDHGRPEDAALLLESGAANARAFGDTVLEGAMASFEAAARAELGDLARAEAAIDVARARLRGRSFVAPIVEVNAGHLDVARARSAARNGDLSMWSKHRSSAAERIANVKTVSRDGSLYDRSSPIRIAVRILERALSSTPAEVSTTGALDLRLASDGSFFEIGGARADLSRRTNLRSIVVALARAHESSPGDALSSEALVAAGWPSTKMLRSAAQNRLHVALVTLRSLGLKSALERSPQGYRLRPSLHITWV